MRLRFSYPSAVSSGAWLANELACKYPGDTQGHAVRGVVTNSGGLPIQPQFSPVCSSAPMAGFWVWSNDLNTPDSGIKYAIARAMKRNGCTLSDYAAAQAGQLSNYPSGGGNSDMTCQLILGCPNLSQYPLVSCTLNISDQSQHESIFNPGAATFLKALAAP